MHKRITHIFFLLLFFGTYTQAQVFPPDFLCVRGDTLFWDIPTNTCGSFNAYEVYASQNINGPYTIIGTVTDINQDFFFHNNALGFTWYYYLASNHNCPGEPVLFSDTLDNLSPEMPDIDRVTVSNGIIKITWPPSPSPETIGYIIFKQTPSGTIPTDTVYNSTEYFDVTTDPSTEIAKYFVLTIDACNNSSIFNLPHNNMLLSANVSVCDQSATLSWNQYANWPTGIGSQEIWVSRNGSNAVPVDTISNADSTFILTGLDDSTSYCVSARAIRNGDTISAFSNEVCFTTDIVQPVRQLQIKSVSSLGSGEWEIRWVWNDNAEITTADVLTLRDGDDVIVPHPISSLSPLTYTNNMTLSLGDVGFSFHITTIDQCDTIVKTGQAHNVFLSGIGGQTQNSLQWTPLEIPGITFSNYEVYSIQNNNAILIATITDSATTNYIDAENTDTEHTESCYFIIARGVCSIPGSPAEFIACRSNTICLSRPSTVWMPNAFAPRGRNPEFKPLILFSGSVTSYQMQIFDRWGRQIFESDDPSIGWGWSACGEGYATRCIRISYSCWPAGRTTN